MYEMRRFLSEIMKGGKIEKRSRKRKDNALCILEV